MYIDYQAGNLDAMYGVGTTVASQVEAANGGQGSVQYVSNNDVAFIMLNEDNEYLADPAVREAIACALDMTYITDVAYGLLGTPPRATMPPPSTVTANMRAMPTTWSAPSRFWLTRDTATVKSPCAGSPPTSLPSPR